MQAQPGNGRPRLLLFSEAVTLAHIARPYALGVDLVAAGFEIHLARAARYDKLLGDALPQRHDISSITPTAFNAALARGAPLYDFETLKAYVDDDLRVIAEVEPDAIIGDFRLSLAVSAAVAGVPYLALANAYWSPYCRQRYPVPELPFVQALGPTVGQLLFSAVRPLAFALHCLPMHRLRRHYGLRSLGANLNRVYTHGDCTLYADAPGLFEMRELPDNHHFIGPLNWS
ncbi:MAG: glycosyl transferase family 1, partial [Halioglobus sp.]|nr:glycosyl transferase family 1 [Halioglobus sp.]